MSRIPPVLLYLTIYNPTLRPDISQTHEDDEDAEEQAQILFYTSRDRAVSRDKMLRQVGVAKALVNFAEIFHSTDPCQNVHSQSRRMVMVSPEPHFWMHVAVELAKTPHVPAGKPKARDKGKGKAREEDQSQVLQLDFHDGSLHDLAIRAHLLRGYEQFKLTHGSFRSILSSLGREALELQLERFFTVWAWSWDLDKDFSFGTNLGVPLHPSYQSIHPVIDNFSLQIPQEVDVLVLTRSHAAPSSRYRNSKYPVALVRHLMNQLIPTPMPAAAPPSATQLDRTGGGDQDDRRTTSTESPPSGGLFGVSISTSMDVRKWAWPSFAKGPDAKEPVTTTSNGIVTLSGCERTEAQVDQSALEDAIASENSFGLPEEKRCASDNHEKHVANLDDDASTPRPSRAPSPTSDSSGVPPNCSSESDNTAALYGEKPQFTWTDVFLAPGGEPLDTSRRRIYLLKRGEHALALLGSDLDADGLEALAKPSLTLLEDVDRTLSEDSQGLATPLPSVTKILQPKDSHILKSRDYVNASPDASLDLDHLFEAKGLLDRDPTVVEVFSRGLYPQHWHVASRVVTDLVEDGKGEAYLEVSRKEATLSDVDNILRGLYKTYV